MKISRYNYFYPYEDSVLGINLIKGIKFAITKDRFETIIKNKIIDKELLEKPLFSLMNKMGVIIPKDWDEYLTFKLENRRAVFNNDTLRITINPTLNCNFGCWYCYETHEKSCISKQTLLSIEKLILKTVIQKKIKWLHLDWFGGEPLMCFNNAIYPLSLYVKELCAINNISFLNTITTNGFLLNSENIRRISEISMTNFQISIDGHRNSHDNSRKTKNNFPTYDRILKNVNSLIDANSLVKVFLRINYSKDNLSDVEKIVDDIRPANRKNVEISMQHIWQARAEEGFIDTKSIEKQFEKSGFVKRPTKVGLKYYNCYVDVKNQFVINYNGDVFKCTARDFKNTRPLGKLNSDGEIEWITSKLEKYFEKPTFENELCIGCNFLPICQGPCSQKMVEKTDVKRVCRKDAIVHNLNSELIDFYNEYIKK